MVAGDCAGIDPAGDKGELRELESKWKTDEGKFGSAGRDALDLTLSLRRAMIGRRVRTVVSELTSKEEDSGVEDKGRGGAEADFVALASDFFS